MKLLFYSHYFAPSVGGVESIVMSLARGLAELRTPDGTREFEVTLVTQTPREGFNDDVLKFPVVRRPALWRLWGLIRRADVVHIAGPALYPLIMGLISRKPVVIEHHGFQVICPTGQMFVESKGEPCPGHFMAGRRSECWNCDPAMGWVGSRKLWLLTFVRRFLSKKVAANIMPTNWLGEQLKLPRAHTIHHGLVQIEPLPAVEPKKPRVPIIAFQGRLVTTKGALVLFDAAKRLWEEGREFNLVLIGDGPERVKLEGLANQASLQGHVEFAGKLGAAELEAKLRQASIVVVPSLGGEVFGLVVAEAMQRGLPVVASDLGAFQEVLGDAGIIFRTGNAGELSKKISELLTSQSGEQIGKRGRERISKFFSSAKMVNEHRLLYQMLSNGVAERHGAASTDV